jgi:hypothetical protein
LLSIKIGRETAENLTTFIEDKIQDEVETKTSILATKQDLARIREDLIKMIVDTKSELIKMIGDTKAELVKMNGDGRADVIKWMFVFWVGQAATTVGLILLFIKK